MINADAWIVEASRITRTAGMYFFLKTNPKLKRTMQTAINCRIPLNIQDK